MRQHLAFHELSNIWPLATKDEQDELRKDIVANGQREKITLYEGKILDGRNRYNACVEAGRKPRVEELPKDVDALAYLVSKNQMRRNLTVGQKAMIGIELAKLYEKKAKERQLAGVKCSIPFGDSRDLAGAAIGVSGKTIQKAKNIMKNGTPELVEAVVNRGLSVTIAERLTKRYPDKKQQVQILGEGIDAVKAATNDMPVIDPLIRLSALMDQCDLADVQALLLQRLGPIGFLESCFDRIEKTKELKEFMERQIATMKNSDRPSRCFCDSPKTVTCRVVKQ